MTTRTSIVKLDTDDNLKELSTSEITSIIDRCVHLYGTDPSVLLNVGSNGDGTIKSITMVDSRLQAGAMTETEGNQNADATDDFPTSGDTADVTTTNVSSSTPDLGHTVSSASYADSSDQMRFPIYTSNSRSELVAMSVADMNDTFFKPAVDKLIDGTDRPGIYKVHTTNSLSGHTLSSTDFIYKDTRADASAYTAGAIPEALDQPTTINTYYLHRKDHDLSNQAEIPVMRAESSGVIQAMSTGKFDNILKEGIRNAAANLTGYKIRYSIEDSSGFSNGNVRGATMTDTKLDGSTFETRKMLNNAGDSDDRYRAQEFPAGTPQTISSYYLRVYRE